MSTEWEAASSRLPDYHDDPTLGGPPVVSIDGLWWWNGEQWVRRQESTTPAA